MYEIYEGIKAELNRITPYTVKKYKETLEKSGLESTKSIMETVEKELPKKLDKEGTVTKDDIVELVAQSLQKNVTDSLNIYLDKEFYDEWLDLVFKLKPEEVKLIKESDFLSQDSKFSIDEFMRGYSDFFARLRGRSN